MQGGKSSNYARMLNEEDNNNYNRQCLGPKRLGVTFLASEWGSSKGGLSTLNRELAINIAKDPRIKVSYFVPSCNDEDKTAAHSHKIELIKAPRRPGLDELEWLNFPPKDLQIDIVVGHGVKLGHQAQIIRESHECKWIQVVHTDPEELGIYKEYPNPISNAQKKHKTEVELCELADFVVPVGPKLYKAFRSYLASCKKEQCFFEFTPGILAEFSELKQSLEKREVCKVLCFGRGDSEDFKLKGFDIAARAMAKLSHCILLFVGAAEGKLEETRTRFLDFDIPPSQLRVRPFLDSREDLKKVFCEADLVVMPSRTEGFGLTGLEALSAGLPILVSRKSGFAEALLKIPFGRHFVVDSDDQDQWAKAIGEVCNNDRSSRLEECETLRDTYKKKYSWKKQCESLIDKMISITLDDKPEDCACAADKSTLPHQTEVNNGLCSDKPEDCACAAEKSTLPHQTEVSNGLCSGNDLQPFPEEWYQHGYIESDQRLETGEYGYDDTAHGAAMQSQSAWVPRWKDDRMGLMEHPSRGLLTTCFEETKLNILSVYDEHSGTWLKMPLSWEMYVPDVKSRLVTIQETFPYWTDTSEILALLRQCNYDLDEVLNTYMTLFEDANPTEEKTPLKLANSSAISKEQAVEMEGLTKRIGQLEEQLRDKDSQLQESQRKNLDLQEKLRSAAELARKLQIKGTSLQREIQQLKSAQTQPQQPVVATVAVATPKEKRVSKDTCLNIKSSIKFFSEKLAELRNCFSSEMHGLYSVLNQAQGSLRKMKQQNQGSSKELIELRALYHKEVLERKLLYNKLQELRGNIRVFCRCRFDPNADDVLNFSTDQDISLVSAMGQKKSFRFDRVFFSTSTQEEVFQDTLPLITSCVDGYNVCIMAYGQTGSGKTYTMMGTNEDPGVNIRSILELLRVCDERTTVDYTMCVSMVEVYNETVRDLLSESGSSQQLTIQMRNKQLVITDVTEANVKSAADIKGIMEKGDSNRSVGATKMNTNSSRSHLLLLLKLHGTNRVTNAVTRGTLTLVDLAGSERISKTEAAGQRLVEAAAINKSLSALGQVFAALRTNAMHVPYRNSKLTQLMQSSLGGDGKACLFVNVSPLASNLSETASTLQFGSAAKQVELGKAKQNIT